MADVFSMSTLEKVSIEFDPVKSRTVNLQLRLLARDEADEFRSPNIPSASLRFQHLHDNYVSNRAQ